MVIAALAPGLNVWGTTDIVLTAGGVLHGAPVSAILFHAGYEDTACPGKLRLDPTGGKEFLTDQVLGLAEMMYASPNHDQSISQSGTHRLFGVAGLNIRNIEKLSEAVASR
jgi:hypothetical protein